MHDANPALTIAEFAAVARALEALPPPPIGARVGPRAYRTFRDGEWPTAATAVLRRLAGIPGPLGQIPIVIDHDLLAPGEWKILGRDAVVLASGNVDEDAAR